MSKQSSNNQAGKVPQDKETPATESAELQAALAHFSSVLEKAVLPSGKDDEVGPEKSGP